MDPEPTRTPLPLGNETVAGRLEEVAELLEAQGANPYRVRAYRRAAATLRALAEPVHELLTRAGPPGLIELPGIGDSLARCIAELVHSDHFPLLERLRGGTRRLDVLTTVPGIGPRLAQRIHDELGIEGLAELELAAHDGRLARVAGMGRGRVQAVRESLAGRFRRGPVQSRPRMRDPAAEPHVAELLDVDREYRERARARSLPRITPRRFNPQHEAWLPVLHTARGARHYTALYSNTAHAHEFGRTHDWVVIYRDDGQGDGQWTVVTAGLGRLAGRRSVRGRERECERHYFGGETPAGGPPPTADGAGAPPGARAKA